MCIRDRYEKFLVIADKKKEVFDEDLIAIMQEGGKKGREHYALDYIYAATGTGMIPTATVKISKGEKIFEDAATGDGPIDAVYKSINQVLKVNARLLDYQIKSITKGREAQGEVTVRIVKDGIERNGRGMSTDIIVASAKAYLDALSKIEKEKTK